MIEIDKQTVLDRLDTLIDPISKQGLTTAGLVRGLVISPGRIGFMLEVPSDKVTMYGPVRLQAEKLLNQIEGVKKAQVVLTAEVENPTTSRESTPQETQAPKARLSPQAIDQIRPKAPVPTKRPNHVRHVVVVGSGKGGVGKSTVSFNLALGLKSLGLSVGWLDADVYGPSAPILLGMTRPPAFNNDKMMIPPQVFGLKVNSVGFLVDADQAMIWRGPMASQAITQLLTQTAWGSEEAPLDVLIIDMPPGTGDVQLTLNQKTLIDGGIVVSTPQDMALIDARRAVTLFEKTAIKVLGVVENMSYFMAPDGTEIEIFGRGGARKMAECLKLPFLGEVPLDSDLRKASDDAMPLTSGVMAERFKTMAMAVWKDLSHGQ